MSRPARSKNVEDDISGAALCGSDPGGLPRSAASAPDAWPGRARPRGRSGRAAAQRRTGGGDRSADRRQRRAERPPGQPGRLCRALLPRPELALAAAVGARGPAAVGIGPEDRRRLGAALPASGYNDAITAYGEAKAVGQPAGSAIYFAVDFNAQRLAPIERYFRGVAAGLAAAGGGRAEYKIGVYGSGVVCAAIKQAGLAQYSWLSNATAWSGSRDYDDWDIRQSGPLADLPFNHDSDEAKTEYGGFQIANAAAAAPYADAGPPAGMPAFGTMAAATSAGAAPRTRPSPLPAGS